MGRSCILYGFSSKKKRGYAPLSCISRKIGTHLCFKITLINEIRHLFSISMNKMSARLHTTRSNAWDFLCRNNTQCRLYPGFIGNREGKSQFLKILEKIRIALIDSEIVSRFFGRLSLYSPNISKRCPIVYKKSMHCRRKMLSFEKITQECTDANHLYHWCSREWNINHIAAELRGEAIL